MPFVKRRFDTGGSAGYMRFDDPAATVLLFDAMTNLDYAFNYNGLDFGAGTLVQVTSVTGLEDLPDVRRSDLARARRAGFYLGQHLPEPRVVDFELLILDSGAGDFFTTINALQVATAVRSTDLALTFKLPGRNQRVLNCRPLRRRLPVNTSYQSRYGVVLLEFFAVDPYEYDATLTTLTLNVPTGAGTGLSFPATAPLVFSGASATGSGVANNLGDFTTPWTATINGPASGPALVNPQFQCVEQNKTLQFIGTLNTGDQLVVDSQARTVLLNGASRYNWLVQGAQSPWFDLNPGVNTIAYSAASGSGTMAFQFRSAWL